MQFRETTAVYPPYTLARGILALLPRPRDNFPYLPSPSSCRVRTAKFFERAKHADVEPAVDSDPYAVTKVKLSADGKERELAVVGASGQVLFFRFKRKETATETR